jgi:hypothetical protein
LINEIINSNPQSNNFLESILLNILSKIHKYGPICPKDLETLSYVKLFHADLFAKYEKKLLFLMGLFYKVETPSNFLETVYSIFADSIKDVTNNDFTPVQADAYVNIKEKHFFSFSAPTSAGKSFLFKKLIVDTTGDIVIVVPSRALIAEYLITVKALVGNDVLVLQFIENVNILKTRRRIFIVTPERGNQLFSQTNPFNIELFLFDEAQLSEEAVRGISFDAFVRRTNIEYPNATKVFSHPFVNNPEAQLKKHNYFINSASSLYKQNSVGKIFLVMKNQTMYYFSPYEEYPQTTTPLENDFLKDLLESNRTLLVYTSKSNLYKPDYLNKYGNYLKYCPVIEHPTALKYIEQIRDYIGAGKSGSKKESQIVRLMERGIVIHHGSMPLKMRLIIEQFVRDNYAKICFATSTLVQGINMPFDAVFIDNYRKMDPLTLKNLIGRAGRSTVEQNKFDYGYTIIKSKNLKSFCERINQNFNLEDTSKLDCEDNEVSEDNKDLVDAMKNNSFDGETRLTQQQIQRIQTSNFEETVAFLIDKLFIDDKIITGNHYYEKLSSSQRNQIKAAFKDLYTLHLRRKKLKLAEQSILSTSIPILLWHIQGKSFKEVLALRYSYLTRKKEQRIILKEYREHKISRREFSSKLNRLYIRYSQIPTQLPNISARKAVLFPNNLSVDQLNYDLLVFDTYDYIDKVITLSIADPICAAFMLYANNTKDNRATKMSNYIRYGTDDPTEIWLLRYGFSFEEISWIKEFIVTVDDQEIVFKKDLSALTEEQFEIIKRYL